MRYFLITLITLSLCNAGAQSFKAVIQKGHGEVVKTARFSADGKYLFTGSRDKTARVWDALTGYEIRSFLGHGHSINTISVYENKLATSSADGTIAVWNILTGDLLWQSEKEERFMSDVMFSQDGKYLAIGGLIDTVKVYDAKDFSLVKKIRTNPDRGVGYGVDLEFSRDGKYLAIGEDQRTAKIYQTSDWSLVYEFKPEKGYCGGCGSLVTFDPSSEYLLKLSNSTALVKYDLATGKEVCQFGVDFDDIVAVSYHGSGNYYLAGTEDSVWLFNKKDDLISSFNVEGKLNDASFHPSEESLLLAVDKVVIETDFEGNEINRFDGILNASSTGLDYDLGSYWEHYIARWVKYKPARFLEEKSFFVGKTGNKARKWGVKSASIEMEYLGHEKGILCFERIDAQTIATGGGDGNIMIWNEKTGQLIQKIKAHREPVFDLKVSNDGSLLASSAWDGVINFWDTKTWRKYKYVYNEGNSAYEIEFSENDAYLITALLDKSLQLLEIETGRFVKELVGHTNIVTSIEVRENDVLTSGWDGNIIHWDLYSGLIKKRIKNGSSVFAARFSEDQIVSVGADRNLVFWDENGAKTKSIEAHQAEITGLQISGNMLMTSDVDGVTKFWNLSGLDELYQHIQIGKNDWMVRSSEGYFDATNEAISNIHFVRGMDVIGADQVMDKFYVPGLVEEIFASGKGRTSVGAAIDKSPPPWVKLNGVTKNEGSATLYLKVEDKGGGVDDVKLYHNDKLVPFEESLQKSRSEDDAKIYTLEANLVAGLNEFSVSAASKSGIESNRASITLYSDSKVPGSTCHVLAVGINEYENQSLNLNYARPDATSFSAQMKKQGEAIYNQVVIHPLYDREASKESILAKVKELQRKVSINDVFIFYFAGHGSMVDGDFYLVSSKASRLYDNAKIRDYGIQALELQEAMLEIKALKQLIIMDACQSGGSVELIAQRGAPEEKAIAQLSRSSGIHVMAAAGSDQYATEFESLGHGLFTYALLKALSGDADGAPKDGKVTIFELKSYLDDQVPELSLKYKGTPQYPHTFSVGQDFPVVVIEN